MKVTEVRIALAEPSKRNQHTRLLGFAAVVLDGAMVIRDFKVLASNNDDGRPFVAMPSRKVEDRCPCCRRRNGVTALFCNACGAELDPARGATVCRTCDGLKTAPDGTECPDCKGKGHRLGRLYQDVAHPITSWWRKTLEDKILDAYRAEVEHPGSVPELVMD